MFISAAINKYIYITLQKSSYSHSINLRYSETEDVESVDEIKHDIIRETFRYGGIEHGVALTSHADIPSGTGLGSSGSFGVGVLHAIYPDKDSYWLANTATHIQKDILHYPIGLQDQYLATFGGTNIYEIGKDGSVIVKSIEIQRLQEKLVMFYTGIKRDANKILASSTSEGLEEVQSIAYEAKDALEGANYAKYGVLLDKHWQEKKKRSPEMSNPDIDRLYELGKQNGALGGKIIGAGVGGFLLFYTDDNEKIINAMPFELIV